MLSRGAFSVKSLGRRTPHWWLATTVLTLIVLGALAPASKVRAAVTREEVERSLREGVRFLKSQQRADGSWAADTGGVEAPSGTTSLVTLALLTAGEPVDSPAVARAMAYLRNFTPEQMKSVYAVSLQTMALAALSPSNAY